MEQLRNKFDYLNEKYQSKKEFFQKTIKHWEAKGWSEFAGKGKQLMQNAESLIQEIRQMLTLPDASQNQSALKAKIKQFKSFYKELHEATKPVWRQWIEAIVIALTLAFVLRHTVFSPYHVPTGSAEPNILVGDRIWGNKMAYYFNNVQRGDLVIFDDARPGSYDNSSIIQRLWQRWIGFPIPVLGLKAGPINVVKRVIAIPGDTIQGKIEDGKTVIYLNGKKLHEPYVNPYPLISLHKTTGFFEIDGFGPFKIPDFLRKKTTEVHYTYDSQQPYEKQPYYTMTGEQVINNPETGEPILYHPFSPNYALRFGDREIYSVDTFGPLTVPAGMYWVMGDSRKNSDDSRYWNLLPEKFIRGRASFIIFSLDSEEVFWLFDLLKHPIDFWTKHVRWNRFFKRLDGYNGKTAE